MLNAMKSGSLDIGNSTPAPSWARSRSCRATGTASSAARAGAGSAASSTSRTRPTTSTRSSRSCTCAAVRVADRPAGDHQGRLPRLGGAGLRSGPVGADVAVRPADATKPPYPLQPERRRSRSQGPRLERRARRSDDLRQGGHGDGRVRRRHPGGHAVQVRLGQPARVGRLDRGARVRGVRARGQEAAGIDVTFEDQDVQLPDRRTTTTRTRRPPSTRTTGASTTTAACSWTTTRPRTGS